jgi:hypothetical protein
MEKESYLRDTRQLPWYVAPCSAAKKLGFSLAGTGAIPYQAMSDNALWFHIIVAIGTH